MPCGWRGGVVSFSQPMSALQRPVAVLVAGAFLVVVAGTTAASSHDHVSSRHVATPCIASLLRQLPCPEETGGAGALSFHVSALKFTGTAVVPLPLLTGVALLIGFLGLGWSDRGGGWRPPTPVTSRFRQFWEVHFWPVWVRLHRWLAILRQRDAAVAVGS